MHLTALPCKQMQTDLGKIPIERLIYVTEYLSGTGQGGGILPTESSNLSAAGSGCLWKRVGV